jgi:hypothetical protein
MSLKIVAANDCHPEDNLRFIFKSDTDAPHPPQIAKKPTWKNIFHLLHPNLHLHRIRIMGNNFAAPNNPPYSGA